MSKIDTTDEKTRRHWERRIARFEGIETITKGYWVRWGDERARFFSVERYGNENSAFEAAGSFAVKKGVDVIPHVYASPPYATSLPDLFRVLRKIGFYKVFGDEKSGHCCYLGHENSARCFDTPEDAIFHAVCQYLRHYHPTVGEQAEDQERGAE